MGKGILEQAEVRWRRRAKEVWKTKIASYNFVVNVLDHYCVLK
jgi:hypothetical protein